MRAAYVTKPGPPESIIIGDLPTPEPTGDQVGGDKRHEVEREQRCRHGPAGPLAPAQRAPARSREQDQPAERADLSCLRDAEAQHERAGRHGPGGEGAHDLEG